MARLIVYYAHPGHKHSHVNRHMARAAAGVEGITFVDLYRDYPRLDIDIVVEQTRLLEHDVILFEFPMFWYSTPSIIKEWEDLVLEHGFAYGADGDKLAGQADVTGRNGRRTRRRVHAARATSTTRSVRFLRRWNRPHVYARCTSPHPTCCTRR